MAQRIAPSPLTPTAERKADHLRINLQEDVAAKGISSGYEAYRFLHRALPEIDLGQVTVETELLGWPLRAPLFISCMTGGTADAEPINCALAEAAEELGIVLGLGSARVLLEQPEAMRSFDVRRLAPHVPLLANLGAIQLNRGVTVDHCRRLLGMLDADALVLHLNPLQEALQPGGDTCFAGLLRRIEALSGQLEQPVIVKEVGWGIAADLVRQLHEAGVAAVDVAGAGGTSWSEVERHRLGGWRERVAAAFAGWGIPSAQALREARTAVPDAVLLASGGIRSGSDLAVALALGAQAVGAAGPFLRAAASGSQECVRLAREWLEVLRITMFCIGAADLSALRGTPHLVSVTGGQPAAAGSECEAVALLGTLIEALTEVHSSNRVSLSTGPSVSVA